MLYNLPRDSTNPWGSWIKDQRGNDIRNEPEC